MFIIANTFSLNMVPAAAWDRVTIEATDAASVAASVREGAFRSIVGHADTARVLSTLLGVDVEANRETFTLGEKDVLLVAQYNGPRLPEGATTLPAGATITWARVSIAWCNRATLIAFVEGWF